jgi:tetraacyldisaccharide 4'-kinase
VDPRADLPLPLPVLRVVLRRSARRERIRALAFCAVGNPESFRATLAEAGVEPAGFAAFRDHHSYRDRDLRALEESAARAGASALLTTEKDAVKLAGRTRLPLFAARIEAELLESGFVEALERRLAARAS